MIKRAFWIIFRAKHYKENILQGDHLENSSVWFILFKANPYAWEKDNIEGHHKILIPTQVWKVKPNVIVLINTLMTLMPP